MSLSSSEKAQVMSQFGISEADSGSAPVQVALITSRLQYLQEHFKKHKHDHHSRRGLLKLVGRRRRLLDYIKKNNVQDYRDLIAKLGIRK